jgi:hypothetical protein
MSFIGSLLGFFPGAVTFYQHVPLGNDPDGALQCENDQATHLLFHHQRSGLYDGLLGVDDSNVFGDTMGSIRSSRDMDVPLGRVSIKRSPFCG